MLAGTQRKPKASPRGRPAGRRRAAIAILAGLAAAPPAHACEPAPLAVRELALPRFYADAAGSEIDPRQKAAHAWAVEPLRAFVGRVAADADKAWTLTTPGARAASGQCAAAWIAAWAAQDALLGRMDTPQAEYQRKWDHAGLALAYLKVRHLASAEQRNAIETWLIRLADAGRRFFDDPGRKRNNHWYWLGLGLGATARASASETHWQAARGIFGDAMRDIGPDGTLAHEMARGPRALHYHDFAVMPLVILAELAAARGEDWYAGEGAALQRLVQVTLAGHADPALFDRLVGVRQERPVNPPAGWAGLYTARFPEQAPGLPVPSRPGHRWIGGDAAVLSGALGRR